MSQFSVSELEHIRESMDVYTNTTNLSGVLIDECGIELLTMGNSCNFCQRIKDYSGIKSSCHNAHKLFFEQSVELGEAYISYCPAGLVHYTAAISIGNVHKGAFVVGPIHMSEPDIYEMDQFITHQKIPLKDRGLLKTYYKNITMISPTTARYQLQLLNLLVNELVEETKKGLTKQKHIYDNQRLINEAVQELKEIESMASTSMDEYPIHLEKELNTAIVKGDENSAKALLNEILGFVFFKYMGDEKKIISKSIELVVVMSRAAIDGGAKYEVVSEITETMYRKAINNTEIDMICVWLSEVLESLITIVFPIKTEKEDHRGILRKAIIYINTHVYEQMTLSDVSNEIALSPTYFSRLFKSEMNMTFIEYLNRIRVEESKRYLVDNSYSISDIAIRLGFTDQSYFSKVFKKYEGITPGRYRKMY